MSEKVVGDGRRGNLNHGSRNHCLRVLFVVKDSNQEGVIVEMSLPVLNLVGKHFDTRRTSLHTGQWVATDEDVHVLSVGPLTQLRVESFGLLGR